jgi:hypothetical protein
MILILPTISVICLSMGLTVPPSPINTPSATPTTNPTPTTGQQQAPQTETPNQQDAFSQFMTRMVRFIFS